MGLADFIEQVNESQGTGNAYENESPSLQIVPDIDLPQKKPIPERLKFLKPCPICNGREFTHGKKGGFFCDACQPDVNGLPVRALGHRMAQCLPKKNQPKTVNKIRPNREELAKDCFTVGFPWIMEHLGELSAAGWTRPELFRRAKHRWCTGNWGVAWLSIWRRPDLVIEIKPAGSVLFTFPSGGRIVTQSAYPEKKISIPQQTHS